MEVSRLSEGRRHGEAQVIPLFAMEGNSGTKSGLENWEQGTRSSKEDLEVAERHFIASSEWK